MKKTLILILTIVLLYSCKKDTKIDSNFVIEKFKENADRINSLEYRIQRIDTFAQSGSVWNNTGSALIEKNRNDKVFGFSIYGKRDDIAEEYLYDAGNGFEISKKDKTYQIHPGYYRFIGSPGGQMVAPNIFNLDSIYKTVTLSETKNYYILTYEFENDTVYNATDIVKKVELRKSDFFPIKVSRTSNLHENKSVSQTIISDLKINGEVSKTIIELKSVLKDYTIIQPADEQPNRLLSQKLPELKLPDLFNENKIVTVNSNKLTLIDFWEVWCGPCIASFPKVENLKNSYSELMVIGIVTEDKENAIKLIEKKGTTFINLVGSKELIKTFNVNGWPRYFLVDKDGILQKEYFGFSEQIEKDIKELLTK